MKKIKIMCDSPADIPREEATEYGITIVPLTYTFDGKTYWRDFYDRTNEEFYEILKRDSPITKTSQIPVSVFLSYFKETAEDEIICFTMTSAASGTYQSAVLAAQDIESGTGKKITVVDTQTYTYIYGRSVVKAAQMAREGYSTEEIIKTAMEMIDNIDVYFTVKTLDYLQRGGRIKMATVFVANLLDVKPVLTVRDGLIVGAGKIRGGKNLHSKLVGVIKEKGYDLNNKEIMIVHCADPAEVGKMAEAVKAEFRPKSIRPVTLGATIGCHTGPHVIGVAFEKIESA